MTIVGIDYSLTCPCVCVSNNKSFEDSYFHFLTDTKKHTGQYLENILGDLHDEYLTDQQRYENIASWVLNIVDPLPKSNVTILIEDYAFAAKGRVFNLAENCGLLKYLLYKREYNFHTVAPSVIKKHATGKGNANKELMYAAFEDLTGVDLIGAYGAAKGGKVNSPITDIIDSFYLTQWMWDNQKSEKIDRGTNKRNKGKRSDTEL